MYTLKDNCVIKEIECGNNFEYVLENNNDFVNTDYKVLLSQTNGIFVQCMKVTRNGKTALFYLTEDYRPMSSLFTGITADTLINIVVNMFAKVIEVRNNGFLACQCIDLSWDKVFVEQSTLMVKLVYIPISVKIFDSYSEFESELRSGVVKLINKVFTSINDRLSQFIMDLCNGSLSLEDLYNRSRNSSVQPIIHQDKGNIVEQSTDVAIKLVAMNAPSYFEILIDKEIVVIGKKQELVDKAISFNKMISRKHCKIERLGGKYYICDEGSANGTFVNGTKVNLGQKSLINRGDIIRLADSDFQIV